MTPDSGPHAGGHAALRNKMKNKMCYHQDKLEIDNAMCIGVIIKVIVLSINNTSIGKYFTRYCIGLRNYLGSKFCK